MQTQFKKSVKLTKFNRNVFFDSARAIFLNFIIHSIKSIRPIDFFYFFYGGVKLAVGHPIRADAACSAQRCNVQ